MSDVQDRWNEYYSDKIWIDTKGWCHLDGTPYTTKDFKRFSDKRVSFFKTIFKTILYEIILLIITGVCMSIFFENTHTTISLIYFLLSRVLCLRCIWIIIKNLFKRNLKL